MNPRTLNKVTMIGNIAAEPESPVVDERKRYIFPLAVERTREGKDAVDYFKVESEFDLKDFNKGDLVLVEGWLMNDFYTKSTGERLYFTKIVLTQISKIKASKVGEKMLLSFKS